MPFNFSELSSATNESRRQSAVSRWLMTTPAAAAVVAAAAGSVSRWRNLVSRRQLSIAISSLERVVAAATARLSCCTASCLSHPSDLPPTTTNCSTATSLHILSSWLHWLSTWDCWLIGPLRTVRRWTAVWRDVYVCVALLLIND